MTSSYIPEQGGANLCEPPITRAALIVLRNAGDLQKDCHYVITDYNRGTVGPAQILLHATDVGVLSQTAMVKTGFDNTAWTGRYDIDTDRITELRDDVENVVIGEDTVDAFPWGVAAVTRNYVSESTLTYVSGLMNRNLIENGANVTVDSTFEFNEISGTVIVDASGTRFNHNRVQGEAQVTLSATAVAERSTFKDNSTVTMIAGESTDNEFSGASIYVQVANAGTIDRSKIGGDRTVTNAVALDLCELFSTSLNTTGSTGSIRGVEATRSIISLQNIVAAIDIDDCQFADTDLDGVGAQQVTMNGVNTSGDANIDIGAGAILTATQSSIDSQGTLNANAGRLLVNGLQLNSQGNLTCNSSSLVVNSVLDSVIRTGGALSFNNNSESNIVNRSIIQNQADVRHNVDAIGHEILTTTIDETQVLITGTGAYRHGSISGTNVVNLQDVVFTNVNSHATTINVLGSVGSVASSTFERGTFTVINTPDVDIDGLESGGGSSVACTTANRLDLTNVMLRNNSQIDVEAGSELDVDDCTISDESIIDVNAGILRLSQTTCIDSTIQNTPANALANQVIRSFLAGSSIIRFQGTTNNSIVEFCTVVGNSVISFQGTSDGSTVSRTSMQNRTTNGNDIFIIDSNGAEISGCSCSNDSVIRITGADGGRILESSTDNGSLLQLSNNTAVVSILRCSTENGSNLTLTNTALVASLIESKFLNSFTAQFNFTVGGSKSFLFGSGNSASVIADPANGTPAQNF